MTGRYGYAVSGVVIESELSLPRADSCPPVGAQIALRLTDALVAPESWDFVRTFDDVLPFISMARVRGGYFLRVHHYGDFEIDATGSAIVAAPQAGCSPTTLGQIFLDQILPQVLHLRGQPSFHASAVGVDAHTAIAFVGKAGQGKSTLAASLGLPHGILCDDCLVLRPSSARLEVVPSYPSLRLWADSAKALFADASTFSTVSPRVPKLRVDLKVPDGPLSLRRLYALEASDGSPRLQRLTRRDALVLLTNNLHRLDPEDPRCLREELAFLEEVARCVPVSRLSYRRSYEDLPLVRAAIEDDLRSVP